MTRLNEEERPFRFLISRILWKTGLGHRLKMKVRPAGSPALPFYPRALAATLWLHPDHCDDDQRVLHDLLRPGDTYVDVGANIGVQALMASSRVRENGRVIALEPHPFTYNCLVQSLSAARCHVVTHNVAAGEDSGSSHISDLYTDDQNHLVGPGAGLPVKVVSLDTLLDDVENVRLLKIDTEGAELSVLRGSTDLLRRTHSVMFEVNMVNSSLFGCDPREVTDLLTASGFKIYDPATGDAPLSSTEIGCHRGNLLAVR